MIEQKITDKKLFAHNDFEKYSLHSRQTPLPISKRSVSRTFYLSKRFELTSKNHTVSYILL